MYLDDGLGGNNNNLLEDRISSGRGDLARSGLLVNEAKSCFEPKTRVKSIGHIVHSARITFEVTPEKKDKPFNLLLRLEKNIEYRSCKDDCLAYGLYFFNESSSRTSTSLQPYV